MASNLFKQAMAAAKQSKNMDAILRGNASKYLEAGTYDVTIQAVDTTSIADNKVNFTFVTDDGKSQTDKIFLTDPEGKQLSYALRQVLSAALPNADALGKLLDRADTDDHALEVLTGMKLRVTFRPGKGFQVRALGTGMFTAVALDSYGKELGPITGEFESLQQAADEAKAAGYSRSFLKIDRAEATHGDENVAALNAALS